MTKRSVFTLSLLSKKQRISIAICDLLNKINTWVRHVRDDLNAYHDRRNVHEKIETERAEISPFREQELSNKVNEEQEHRKR